MTALAPFVLFFISFVHASIPGTSSYAQKCPKYNGEEGPIGNNHKATFTCGAYPTEATFTPVPNAADADVCALSCHGLCQGATWSEVTATEFKCHHFTGSNGIDYTQANIMIITPPVPASANDQRNWICPAGQDPSSPELSMFISPNIGVVFHCNKAPRTLGDVYYPEPGPQDLDSCLRACKERTDTTPNVCSGSMWVTSGPVKCYTVTGDGGLQDSPGNLYITYQEGPITEYVNTSPDSSDGCCACRHEDNQVPGGQNNQIPGGPDNQVPGGQNNQVPGGPDNHIPGGQNNQIPGGQNNQVPGGPDNHIPGGHNNQIPGGI